MIRQNFCAAVAAAGFYSSVSIVQASHGNTPSPLRAIEEAYALIPGTAVQEPEAESGAACPAPTVTFDDTYLAHINTLLGDFKNWIVTNGRYTESFPEEFFGSGELSEDDYEIYEAYVALFEYEEYKPGTEEGLAYLKKDPLRTENILRSYTDHAAAQKFMLDEMMLPKNLILMSGFAERMEAARLRKDFEQKFVEPMADIFESIYDNVEAEDATAVVCEGRAAPAP